jgi:hypothetical protein
MHTPCHRDESERVTKLIADNGRLIGAPIVDDIGLEVGRRTAPSFDRCAPGRGGIGEDDRGLLLPGDELAQRV